MTATADPPDGRNGPHVFVADLDRPELSPDDRHHLARVLRVRAGDAVTASDGAGAWRACRFGDELEAAGPILYVPPVAPALTVAFALVKGGRPELIVQKLTELGVDRIVPFAAARSVVQWDGSKANQQAERLRRVAREAAMQSRRCTLPAVDEPTTFAVASALSGAVLAERDGDRPTLEHPVVLVGPEGGWADEERGAIAGRVGFGPQVLRAETAAIAVGAVMAALRAGLVSPVVESAPSATDPTVEPRG